MGPFCATRFNPTHQLTDPTQPNPLQVEKFGPNPTQHNCRPLIYYVLSLLTKFLVPLLYWTQPNPTHRKLKNLDPTGRSNSNQPNPTHGTIQPMDNFKGSDNKWVWIRRGN